VSSTTPAPSLDACSASSLAAPEFCASRHVSTASALAPGGVDDSGTCTDGAEQPTNDAARHVMSSVATTCQDGFASFQLGHRPRLSVRRRSALADGSVRLVD
jgi:hypothetical protein